MPDRPDVIILCGGAGTRLRPVTGDAPKGMATVAGRPFLELLLQQLKRQGFTRIILAVGYQSDIIRSHFGEDIADLTLVYSTELRPLGTAGAIRNAVSLVTSENVLVMNGDSYTDVDLARVTDDFNESKADASVVVVDADDRSDCGFVLLDAGRRVVSFNEKTSPSGARFVNAGIYVMSLQMLSEISSGREISLEREVIPSWLADGKYVKGYIHSGACIDIGTPDRYRSAQSLLAAVALNPSSARA